MRACLLPFLCLVILTGCGPMGRSVYYAEGVDLPRREADLAVCEAEALARYPVRDVTRFTPRRYVPGRPVCTAGGACTVLPGHWEGGDPYSVDVNADPRSTARRGCMGARGYTRVSLPACEAGTGVVLGTVMPPLTGGTCLYSATGTGPSLIVNPAD